MREWSVFAQQGRRIALGVKDREVGNPHAPLRISEFCSAHYRLIWSDGLLSRGHLERRQMELDTGSALEGARAAAYEDPDASWVLGPAPFPEVEMHDPETAVDRGRRHGDLRPSSATGADADRRARVSHLERVLLRRRGGRATGYLVRSRRQPPAVPAPAGSVTINGTIGDGFGARRPESHDAFEQRLDRLSQTAKQLEVESEPLEGGVRPVLLDPGVVEDYVLNTLLANLGGRTVANGEGHFRREQFGSTVPVLREDLGLRIDPLEPFKRGSYRFTGEGVPAAEARFIDRGRLVQPVLGLKYARRLGLKPTPLPLGTDTLYFEGPEPISLDEALPLAAGGALVLSVLGVHTQDSASGDFSLSAPQALRLDPEAPGGYAGRVRVTISGNLFDILSSQDLRFVRFEDEHTPGLLFPCRVEPSGR